MILSMRKFHEQNVRRHQKENFCLLSQSFAQPQEVNELLHPSSRAGLHSTVQHAVGIVGREVSVHALVQLVASWELVPHSALRAGETG